MFRDEVLRRLVQRVHIIGVVTGKVAVIIRAGIGGIVPVQGTPAVGSERVIHGGGKFCFIVDVPDVIQDKFRFVVLPYAGISHFPVLVAPVRVIIIGTGKVIGFLDGSRLRSSFGRSSKDGQA